MLFLLPLALAKRGGRKMFMNKLKECPDTITCMCAGCADDKQLAATMTSACPKTKKFCKCEEGFKLKRGMCHPNKPKPAKKRRGMINKGKMSMKKKMNMKKEPATDKPVTKPEEPSTDKPVEERRRLMEGGQEGQGGKSMTKGMTKGGMRKRGMKRGMKRNRGMKKNRGRKRGMKKTRGRKRGMNKNRGMRSMRKAKKTMTDEEFQAARKACQADAKCSCNLGKVDEKIANAALRVTSKLKKMKAKADKQTDQKIKARMMKGIARVERKLAKMDLDGFVKTMETRILKRFLRRQARMAKAVAPTCECTEEQEKTKPMCPPGMKAKLDTCQCPVATEKPATEAPATEAPATAAPAE